MFLFKYTQTVRLLNVVLQGTFFGKAPSQDQCKQQQLQRFLESLPKGSNPVMQAEPKRRKNGKTTNVKEIESHEDGFGIEDEADKVSVSGEITDFEFLDFPENVSFFGDAKSPASEEQNSNDDFFDKLMSG